MVERHWLSRDISQSEIWNSLPNLRRSIGAWQLARGYEPQSGEACEEQSHYADYHTQQLSAINQGLTKRSYHSPYKKYHRPNCQKQAKPWHSPLPGQSDKERCIAGQGSDGYPKSPPDGGVTAFFNCIRHFDHSLPEAQLDPVNPNISSAGRRPAWYSRNPATK